MTTAQRAKELAEKVRRSYQGDGEEQHDIATGLEELARMLEAALPESVQAVAEEWTGVSVSGALMKSAHSSILTLLDAYRVLAAERDAENRSRLKTLDMAAKIADERDAARAEVERLRDQAVARIAQLEHEQRQHAYWKDRHNVDVSERTTAWQRANAEAAAEKHRADRLAEGVRLYHLERVVSGSYNDDVNAWERANTDLVPRE